MGGSPENAKMLAESDDAIARMIFNNPEKHNAVSLEMWDLADEILDRFEKDHNIRVLIISGAGGKSFVSGADISKFDQERSSEESVRRYNERVRGVYERIESFPKPTIAMIDGFCIGGGLNLAVACDLRFCSAKSRFAMPAARLALGYPLHAIRSLINVVGVGAAKDLMFAARLICADEALRIGLVQDVKSESEIEGFVYDYASEIARNAPLTVAAMKFISGEVMRDPAERNLEACNQMVGACFASRDYVEGRQAFKEKREPIFTGK